MSLLDPDQQELARELHGNAENPSAEECGPCNATAAAVLASEWLVIVRARERGNA